MMDWYNGNGNGMGTGGWLAMIAITTVFLAIVIFAGLMIFRGVGRGRGSDDARSREFRDVSDPQRILDERFARGELDREEYEARKSALHGDRR